MGLFGHRFENIGTSAISKPEYSKTDRRTKFKGTPENNCILDDLEDDTDLLNSKEDSDKK